MYFETKHQAQITVFSVVLSYRKRLEEKASTDNYKSWVTCFAIGQIQLRRDLGSRFQRCSRENAEVLSTCLSCCHDMKTLELSHMDYFRASHQKYLPPSISTSSRILRRRMGQDAKGLCGWELSSRACWGNNCKELNK